jgi:CubicO group peptidase (beta-lactamase class C family)
MLMLLALHGFGQEMRQATTSAKPDEAWSHSPGAQWEMASPESVGYSTARFDALTALLKTEATTAMVVSVHGRIIYRYGDTAYVSKIASVRKSVLSMLYGNYVASGKIDLERTVKEIGLDDSQPFLPIEENAKLEQVLAGRSDIFIVPEKPDPSSADFYQPKRGTETPGTYFTYNEWDFNAAGAAFEKLTGKNMYDALESDLAKPLGMQDFVRGRQQKIAHPPLVHPEYAMYLSTRDMARLGQLMLRQGSWNGKPVIASDWVRFSTSLLTPFQEVNPSGLRNYAMPERWGFGLMWWVWDEPTYLNHAWTGPYQGAFLAMGSGGQYIAVFPREDMVIAHKVDLDHDKGSVNAMEWDSILNMMLGASCFGHCPAK